MTAQAAAAKSAGTKRMSSSITDEVLEQHNLTGDEYRRIVKILGRDPSETELGIFSVMWSEHCSYKSSRVHLKRLPTEGAVVLQGPGENAGIIDIGDGLAVAFKIESHNHPSFIEPFQGAATGVGGILRDIFTMGARPIATMNSLRFGPLEEADNRRIMEGIVGGIAHYGNCFGVPTVGGEVYFSGCYSQNPLVNAFALGIFEKDKIFFGKATGIGNPVIYVGAKTGRDGIHGATMASAGFGEDAGAKRPNVQIGDPFVEKLLLEACLEAMEKGLVVGIQDMGAAGLTCSSCEMGARGGTGVELNLDQVPQRETGMTPYEIMLSESQERMLLVSERERTAELLAVFHKWGLDAVEVGEVTGDGLLRVRHSGETFAEVPNGPLADDAPLYNRPVVPPAKPRIDGWLTRYSFLDGSPASTMEAFRQADSNPGSVDYADLLRRALGSPNLSSRRWIWEQYDHMVQSNTVVGPGSDAAVIRLKGTSKALAMVLDGPRRARGARSKRGRSKGCGRGVPQHRLFGRTAGGRHQLSELRQSRAPRGHVAVQRGRRRNEGGLRGLRDSGDRRQRQLLQRDLRRRHFPDTGHRDGRAAGRCRDGDDRGLQGGGRPDSPDRAELTTDRYRSGRRAGAPEPDLGFDRRPGPQVGP